MEQQVLEVEQRERHAQTRKKGYLLAAVLALIFLIVAATGIMSRLSERRGFVYLARAVDPSFAEYAVARLGRYP